MAALVAAVLIAVSGGFVASAGGVRISARSWEVPAVAAAALIVTWLMAARRAGGVVTDLEWAGREVEASGPAWGRALALAVAVLSVYCASFSASGSDASGYLSQAAMWSRFEWRVPDALRALSDWPLPPAGTTPLGWRAALEPGWQVPTYAPGLPWLMAVPHTIAGTAGAVGVVVGAAGIALWATSALASRLGGGLAAPLAAVLLGTSPTFLVHAFQPMSDVPVTAAWMVCWWLVAQESALGAGAAAAVASAVRPNLAPLAVLPWFVSIYRAHPTGRRAVAVRFALPVAAAGILIAVLQWRWYGSPLTSGYGTAGELFALPNVFPNARLYAAWLLEAEPTIVAAIAAACLVTLFSRPSGSSDRRWLVAGLCLFAGGVVAAYLVYAVFEVWTYVRFLLPSLAVLVALASAAIVRAVRRLPVAARGGVVVAVALVAGGTGLQTARTLGVFQISAVMARAREAGEELRGVLGPRTVILAAEQSGSMRYMTGRPIVRWDTLDEAALDRAPEVEAGPLMRTRAWRVRRPVN